MAITVPATGGSGNKGPLMLGAGLMMESCAGDVDDDSRGIKSKERRIAGIRVYPNDRSWLAGVALVATSGFILAVTVVTAFETASVESRRAQ